MILTGENISLRLAGPLDLETIFLWENDPANWLVSNTVAPFTRDQILNFLENKNDIFDANQMRFMIQAKDMSLAGCTDLFDFDPKNKRVGMGILVDPAFRGKGIGREAISLLAHYCFESLEVEGIYAEILETNVASRSIFEACGFIETGVKQNWFWDAKGFVNQSFYQKLKGT